MTGLEKIKSILCENDGTIVLRYKFLGVTMLEWGILRYPIVLDCSDQIKPY